MYENSKSSIDWKGLFLKVVIAFLIILITITGYKTLKGNNNTKNNTTTKVAESNASTTFTGNISKLKEAGEKYYKDNKDKLPKDENSTTIVTLNELIKNGVIDNLSDENGKNCDGESSYVTATLENGQTKLKANLVCGESSSYSIVYMGENDSEVKKTEESNNTVSKTSNSSSSTKQTNNTSTTVSKPSTNCTNDCTPSISVSTNTSASQNVSINTDKKNNNSTNTNNETDKDINNNNSTNNNTSYTPVTKYYTVTFNKNGGTTYYRSQEVKANGYAKNPGDNYKSGYRFLGWYLNGEEFDFNTPITEDIELIAKYTKNYSSYDDDDYDYNYTGKNTFYTYVYTMGWDTKGTDEIEISHTLSLPEDKVEDLEDDYDIEISKIRIQDIEFYQPLTSTVQLNQYYNKHDDTFIYKNNVWDADIEKMSNLSTIKERDVDFDYDDDYKDIDDAEDEGFDVTWTADDVYSQCRTTFSVNGEYNKCGYGIVYKVTWQYKYYN